MPPEKTQRTIRLYLQNMPIAILLVLLISYLIHSILCIYRGMDTNSSKRNKDSKSSEKDIQGASTGSVTNVGDTSRDITNTADVARASIAKGRVGGGDRPHTPI
jgi:hypothetical protein